MATVSNDEAQSMSQEMRDVKSERTCLVTRQSGTPQTLMRFVINPTGQVCADIKGRLPGRGVWLTPTRDMIVQALKRKVFAKGFKKPIEAPDDLPDQVAALLRRDLLSMLALANKAGALITGSGKVDDALRARRVEALILAREGLDTGASRVLNVLKNQDEGEVTCPIITDLTHDELSMALGKPHVIHAACVRHDGARGFLNAWHRWQVYQGTSLSGK